MVEFGVSFSHVRDLSVFGLVKVADTLIPVLLPLAMFSGSAIGVYIRGLYVLKKKDKTSDNIDRDH